MESDDDDDDDDDDEDDDDDVFITFAIVSNFVTKAVNLNEMWLHDVRQSQSDVDKQLIQLLVAIFNSTFKTELKLFCKIMPVKFEMNSLQIDLVWSSHLFIC